jgi:hypothetical protein
MPSPIENDGFSGEFLNDPEWPAIAPEARDNAHSRMDLVGPACEVLSEARFGDLSQDIMGFRVDFNNPVTVKFDDEPFALAVSEFLLDHVRHLSYEWFIE